MLIANLSIVPCSLTEQWLYSPFLKEGYIYLPSRFNISTSERKWDFQPLLVDYDCSWYPIRVIIRGNTYDLFGQRPNYVCGGIFTMKVPNWEPHVV